jgi:hypothetical protein
VIQKYGYVFIKRGAPVNPIPADIWEADFLEMYQKCNPFTMTSVERMYSLFKAVEYIAQNHLEGDCVECGVWRGGSSMLICLALLKFNSSHKRMYLYDTYEGMSEPTGKDMDWSGKYAKDLLSASERKDEASLWSYSPLVEVQRNLQSTGYPVNRLVFVKGKVEETIPSEIPHSICLLRLDTDWYESTYHELTYLYPRLVEQGILIIDDYGHWKGAKEAVDRYFQEHSIHPLLHRIDYTARIFIKTK